jgi:hypothetical protein
MDGVSSRKNINQHQNNPRTPLHSQPVPHHRIGLDERIGVTSDASITYPQLQRAPRELPESSQLQSLHTLHDKQRGHLQLQQRNDLLRELDKLIEPPDEVPKGCRYLLDLDYSDLHNASFQCQSYWVLAMKAARRTGRRARAHLQAFSKSRRTHFHNLKDRTKKWAPSYDFTNDDASMERKVVLIPKHNKRTRTSANNASNPSNKQLRKPD